MKYTGSRVVEAARNVGILVMAQKRKPRSTVSTYGINEARAHVEAGREGGYLYLRPVGTREVSVREGKRDDETSSGERREKLLHLIVC